MEKMKCWIVYVYQKEGISGIGTCDGYFSTYPPTSKDILHAQEEIKRKFFVDNAVIINWLPLSEDAEKK